MNQMQRRMLVQVLLGFLLGRVVVFGINPVAPAYFAVCYTAGGAVLPVAITILLGMSTVLQMESVLGYGAGMIALVLIADFLDKRKINIGSYGAAAILAVSTAVMSTTRYFLIPYSGAGIALIILESILLFAVARIFRDGVGYLLHGKKMHPPDKESVLSCLLVFGSGVLGMPGELFGNMTIAMASMWIFLVLTGFMLGSCVQTTEHTTAWRDMMKHKLKDFSESFQTLSKAMADPSDKQFQMSRREMREIMQGVSQQVCERCENRDRCMSQPEFVGAKMYGALALAQEQGVLIPEQMPHDFLRECIHLERFVSETNQSLQMARVMMGLQNKMSENRQVMADQMEEVGKLVGGLAQDIDRTREIPENAESAIAKKLQSKRVKALGIMFYEKKDGRLEIHMRARTIRGRLVIAKEVAAVLREVLHKPICLAEGSRQVVSREMSYFVFEEDTPLVAETGIARRTKDGEDISGDVFSCIPLPSGETLVALSDGMGSGLGAYTESRRVIELLEQMAEAGFSEMSALKLINSVYLTCEEQEKFATIDILILNLYQGYCQLLKNGASATYLYQKGALQRIVGQALPIGAASQVEPYTTKVDILPGDYVIMMTDGMADCLEAAGEFDEDIEELLYHYLDKGVAGDPQGIADALMEEAVYLSGGQVGDDMSILVTEIQER